eukprot:4258231-Amphidinium_carterae.1
MQLYASLGATAGSKPAKIIRWQGETANGFECWRLLCEQFEPSIPLSKLTLLAEITEAQELACPLEQFHFCEAQCGSIALSRIKVPETP